MNITQIIITAIITLIFNSLLETFKTTMNWNIDRKKFKRDRAYNQLKGLYFDIYRVIVQSEYVRYLLIKYEDKNIDLDEFPFVEITISKKKEKTTVSKDESGKLTGKKETTKTEIHNDITLFNKEYIYTKIINNSFLASNDLLKIAVAYRYCHFTLQNDFYDTPERKEYFEKEEVRLLLLMVKTIMKESNKLMEICHIRPDGKEYSCGLPNNSIFKENHVN